VPAAIRLVGADAADEGTCMERLSGLDASFLYLETPSLHMQVALTLVLDPSTVPGGYSFDRMKRAIGQRIPCAPIFRRKLVEVPFRLGHPVWVDDPDFDIDYHVRRAAVPSPGGLRELADLTGDIAGHKLDRSRPLWEMWIVENLADEQIALVAKMHHSTVDGVSGAALLSVLFDLEPAPSPPDHVPAEVEIDGRVPSGLELMTQATLARTRWPFEMAGEMVRTLHRLLDVRRIRLGSPGSSHHDEEPEPAEANPKKPAAAKAALPLTAPRTSFNVAVTPRRAVAFTSLGLDDVKRLKNRTGTTVNDVILAICAGALRSFLLQGDELPDKPLVAVVPVSVRPDAGSPKGSNQVSALFVQLPCHLHDPLERLSVIRSGTKGAKEEHNALGADLLLNWAEYATPNVFANAARLYTGMRLANRHRPIANLVISNFPGPDFPLYLAGAELTAGFPLGPVMDGMGVNITVMSYRSVLNWGILVCPESMPRLWNLTAAVPAALAELLAAAGEKPPVFRSAAAEAAVVASGAEPRAPERPTTR
jgi:diacylglycerol O-acyltransferase / wax synthase